MKTLLFTLIAIAMAATPMAAQQQAGNRPKFDLEAFQARRNAYLTAEIGLTAQEAADFIPLENELKRKMIEAGRNYRRRKRELHKQQQPSDAEYLQLIDKYLESRIQEVELQRAYIERFKKILPPRKLHKYLDADRRFMNQFMKETKR